MKRKKKQDEYCCEHFEFYANVKYHPRFNYDCGWDIETYCGDCLEYQMCISEVKFCPFCGEKLKEPKNVARSKTDK
jgi:hypothetical protein